MKQTNVNKLISLFFTTSRIIREHAEGHDRVDPLSFLRLETLRFVAEKKSPTMRNIADYLCVTPSSATSLINGLVKDGELKRTEDETDRRIIRLTVTTKGEDRIKEGFKQVSSRMKNILTKLDEKEINAFIKILEKLAAIYKKK